MLRGKTGAPFRSEGQSLFGGWYRTGWVGDWAAEGLGGSVQPSPNVITESAHGAWLWWARVPPQSKPGHSSHHSLPFPGCSPQSALVTQHLMSLPGCSALAELNSLCHVYAESTHFWGVQLTLLQALIINYQEKWEDALLLYLYKYVHVYLYTYKTKVLYPNTWIFLVQGYKTLLKWSQRKGPFFLFPDLKKMSKVCGVGCELFFYSFSYPSCLRVVRSWPGFFFVLLLSIFVFQVSFVTSDALWEKLMSILAFFLLWWEKKKVGAKYEHGASYARDGNFSLLGSMCISVLNWNYQIIASECPREQGIAFAVAICFLKLALFQCWLKFVCSH